MNNLTGQLGELSFTVTVKRKDTGKEETYQMVGYVDEQALKDNLIESNKKEKDSK